MENKLEKQDLIDIYDILFWIRVGDVERANSIMNDNKFLAQKVFDEAVKR